MKSVLRSTGMLSASTGVTILAGLASAKAWAILVGTNGVGYMGLLLSLLGLISLVAGLGVSTGLVRFGASAIAESQAANVAALRRAAWLITLATGAVALPLLIASRGPISEVALGGTAYQNSVPIIGVALVLGMVSGVQTGILNAYHKVGALARYGVLVAVLGTVAEVPFIWIWRSSGVPFAILATAAVACIISSTLLWREMPKSQVTVEWEAVRAQAGQLLRFGGPYTVSMIVGTGVLLAMPLLVLHIVGPSSVGAYRAAAVIGVTYLGFLLAAMSQDYFPRVSAAGSSREDLLRLVNEQQRLVMLLATPVILGALALAPIIVPLLYSQSFAPASNVLEWQLIGDVFRLSSWTLSFVILARSSSHTFLAVEAIGGAAILLASWLAMSRFGVAGAGMGYLGGYIIYFAAVWLVLRRQIGFRLTSTNAYLLVAVIGAVTLVRLLPLLGDEAARLPVGLLLALSFGAYSLQQISRETGLWRRPLAAQAGSG